MNNISCKSMNCVCDECMPLSSSPGPSRSTKDLGLAKDKDEGPLPPLPSLPPLVPEEAKEAEEAKDEEPLADARDARDARNPKGDTRVPCGQIIDCSTPLDSSFIPLSLVGFSIVFEDKQQVSKEDKEDFFNSTGFKFPLLEASSGSKGPWVPEDPSGSSASLVTEEGEEVALSKDDFMFSQDFEKYEPTSGSRVKFLGFSREITRSNWVYQEDRVKKSKKIAKKESPGCVICFGNDEKIYKCKKCSVHFHEHCILKQFLSKSKRPRVCVQCSQDDFVDFYIPPIEVEEVEVIPVLRNRLTNRYNSLIISRIMRLVKFRFDMGVDCRSLYRALDLANESMGKSEIPMYLFAKFVIFHGNLPDGFDLIISHYDDEDDNPTRSVLFDVFNDFILEQIDKRLEELSSKGLCTILVQADRALWEHKSTFDEFSSEFAMEYLPFE
jgi:hypothetical protein